jgi:hypothetical protein
MKLTGGDYNMNSVDLETMPRGTIKASFNKEAVRAFYDAGYITLEEAEQLSHHSWLKRNECTKLFLTESGGEVWLNCFETTEEELYPTTLFFLSYNKFTGTITDETAFYN